MRGIGECERCWLRRRVAERFGLVDDDPPIRHRIVDALCDRDRARATDTWLYRHPDVVDVLRHAEHDDDPVAAAAVAAIKDGRLGALARLARHGKAVIEEPTGSVAGDQLAGFDRWCTEVLGSLMPAGDRQIITAYATWHHRRRLAREVDAGTLKPWAVRMVRQQTRVAIEFLAWLGGRGRSLGDCRQADIDAWFASGPTTREHTVRFLTWARTQRLCPRLRFPNISHTGRVPNTMAHHERVELVARLIGDTGLPTADRLAGLLVAVYAQRSSRLSQLRRDAITVQDDTVVLRVGDDDVALTPPLDQLAIDMLEELDDAYPDSPWLFPGRNPTQPLAPKSLNERLRKIGAGRLARVTALHDLLGQVPTTILADALGYNPNFMADRANLLSIGWHTYAGLRGTKP